MRLLARSYYSTPTPQFDVSYQYINFSMSHINQSGHKSSVSHNNTLQDNMSSKINNNQKSTSHNRNNKRKRSRAIVSPVLLSVNTTNINTNTVPTPAQQSTRLTRSQSKNELNKSTSDINDTVHHQSTDKQSYKRRSNKSRNRTHRIDTNNSVSPKPVVQISLKHSRAIRQQSNDVNNHNKLLKSHPPRSTNTFVPRFHREIKNVSQAPHNSNTFYLQQTRRNMSSPLYSYELPYDSENKSDFNQYSSSIALSDSPQSMINDVKKALLRSQSRAELNNILNNSSHDSDNMMIEDSNNDADTQLIDLLIHPDGSVENVNGILR